MAAKTLIAGGAIGGLSQPVADLVRNGCLWLGAPDNVCTPLGTIAGIVIGVALVYFAPMAMQAVEITPFMPAGMEPRDPLHRFPPRNDNGQAELSALAAASIFFGCLLLACVVYAGPNVLTSVVTVTDTPTAMGHHNGRRKLVLELPLAGPTAGIKCGPHEIVSSSWITRLAGQQFVIGVDTVDGASTGIEMIECVSNNTTPVPVYVLEEGEMPERTWTPTVTATPTNTPVDTATATPSQTPTDTP